MTIDSFEAFDLTPDIHEALAHMGFKEPSPIQAEAIPHLLEGKDVLGQAQTGTGKTAAFALPIMQKIEPENRDVQAVVVCPTRELALQVADEFRKLAKFKANISIVCVYGGDPMERQTMALGNLPQIIIGTPGRMLDFLWRGTFHLNHVSTVVLDEADEMLNMGFRDDIEKIFDFLPHSRQTVLFSATMPKPILHLTRQYQKDPVMGAGRVANPVDGFDCRIHRGIEANRVVSACDVVVDRAGDADRGKAGLLLHEMRTGEV
jgi:ATP-dependent RNA helicase DeaD